jgi:hypothetical protein
LQTGNVTLLDTKASRLLSVPFYSFRPFAAHLAPTLNLRRCLFDLPRVPEATAPSDSTLWESLRRPGFPSGISPTDNLTRWTLQYQVLAFTFLPSSRHKAYAIIFSIRHWRCAGHPISGNHSLASLRLGRRTIGGSRIRSHFFTFRLALYLSRSPSAMQSVSYLKSAVFGCSLILSSDGEMTRLSKRPHLRELSQALSPKGPQADLRSVRMSGR